MWASAPAELDIIFTFAEYLEFFRKLF